MAVGLASAVAQEILNAIGNDGTTTILTAMTTPYIQLHVADPGAAGTTSVAVNATRKSISFANASAGTMSNDVAVTWTSGEVTGSEDYTHFSIWSASTAGTFIASGTITANPVTAGDEFVLPIGDIDLVFSNIAA